MTFDEFWAALQKKNPDLKEGDTMKITVDSFKRSMRQAFEMGERKASPSSVGGVFEELFGKRV